jgi:Fic family protein
MVMVRWGRYSKQGSEETRSCVVGILDKTCELLHPAALLCGGVYQRHQSADHHSVTDTFLLLNHLEALRFLDRLEPDGAIQPDTILNLHALLAYQLLPPRLETQGGRLRTKPVLIGHSTYTPPSRDTALEPHFKHLLTIATAIPTAVEAALFLLVHLSYLQPFIDANKRTARMAANIPLLRHRMVPLSLAGVDASSYNKAMLLFYEMLDTEPLRDIFVWAYEQSCQRYQPT